MQRQKSKNQETINIAGLLGCSERRSCIICGHLLSARKPCCSGCCLCIQPCPCHFLSHLFFGSLPIEIWPSKIHTLRQRGRNQWAHTNGPKWRLKARIHRLSLAAVNSCAAHCVKLTLSSIIISCSQVNYVFYILCENLVKKGNSRLKLKSLGFLCVFVSTF